MSSDKLVDDICARIYNSNRVRYNEIPTSTAEVIDRLTDMYITLVDTVLTKKQKKKLLKETERLLKE